MKITLYSFLCNDINEIENECFPLKLYLDKHNCRKLSDFLTKLKVPFLVHFVHKFNKIWIRTFRVRKEKKSNFQNRIQLVFGMKQCSVLKAVL